MLDCDSVSARITQHTRVVSRVSSSNQQLFIVVLVRQIARPNGDRRARRRPESQACIYERVTIDVQKLRGRRARRKRRAIVRVDGNKELPRLTEEVHFFCELASDGASPLRYTGEHATRVRPVSSSGSGALVNRTYFASVYAPDA